MIMIFNIVMMIIMRITIMMMMMILFAYMQATYELPIEPEVEAVEEVKEGKKGVEIKEGDFVIAAVKSNS